MTFLRAIDLFGLFMGDTVDIRMAIAATVAAVGAAGKQFPVDIEQAELAVFIDPAEATVLVAHGAIQLILCIR